MNQLSDDNRQHKASGKRVLASAELGQLAAAERSAGHVGVLLTMMGIAVIALALASFCVGRYGIPLSEVLAAFGDMASNIVSGKGLRFENPQTTVVVNYRLPRVLAALLVGAALAVAGASYQGVFRNPMVSSDILGASAGAGFGASIAILLGAPGVVVQLSAFAFGMLAVGVTYAIGSAVGRGSSATLALVLAGIVVQALFQAFVGCVKYMADPYSQLPEITYWLMGSLATVGFDDIALMIAPLLIGCAVLMALRWRVNLLSFGDEEAAAMGVNTRRLRFAIIVCATLVTGSAVSVAGQVGWVGLVIPHLARMVVGPNYRVLVPASFVMGAGFLLVVDDVARNVMQMEIPLGILTAIIGAPVFVFLLLKGKKGWS